jgi:hypothetical protein
VVLRMIMHLVSTLAYGTRLWITSRLRGPARGGVRGRR